MPPAINLTEGEIAMLLKGEAQGSKPVLQVTDIRLVKTQNQNSTERYRILLSDGMHLQQLATQRNDLVCSERLQKGSIVHLTQFVCNGIQNRMVSVLQKEDWKGVIDLVTNAKQVVSSVQGVARKLADQLKHSVSFLTTKAFGGEFPILGYSPDDLTCIDLFESWIKRHGKVYESVEEKLLRFEIFKDNLKYINETNKTLTSYKLGLNVFADVSHEEYLETFGRKKGAVTPVRNPGLHCSCCASSTGELQKEDIVGYSPDDLTCIDLFESWIKRHGRVYESVEEKLLRFEIFKDNLRYINETNKTLTSYKLGLNVFADMSHEEYLESVRKCQVHGRKKGAVTPVRNQGSRSCLMLPPPEELEHLNIHERSESTSTVKRVVYLTESDTSYVERNYNVSQQHQEGTRFNLFTGNQTFEQREQSFKVGETATVHCGFYSENGGFKISDEDKRYMQTCQVVVSACAFGGGDDLYQPIGMSQISIQKHRKQKDIKLVKSDILGSGVL